MLCSFLREVQLSLWNIILLSPISTFLSKSNLYLPYFPLALFGAFLKPVHQVPKHHFHPIYSFVVVVVSNLTFILLMYLTVPFHFFNFHSFLAPINVPFNLWISSLNSHVDYNFVENMGNHLTELYPDFFEYFPLSCTFHILLMGLASFPLLVCVFIYRISVLDKCWFFFYYYLSLNELNYFVKNMEKDTGENCNIWNLCFSFLHENFLPSPFPFETTLPLVYVW